MACSRHRATDRARLLFAAQRNWVVVTNNERDFILLHDAWLRWARTWGVGAVHDGILVPKQEWPAERIVREIHQFLSAHGSITGELWFHHEQKGWLKWEPPPP